MPFENGPFFHDTMKTNYFLHLIFHKGFALFRPHTSAPLTLIQQLYSLYALPPNKYLHGTAEWRLVYIYIHYLKSSLKFNQQAGELVVRLGTYILILP